jgi:transcriptional regulator with XRE-family HTH domain
MAFLMMIVGAQVRAARALLDWSQEKLAKQTEAFGAGVSETGIANIERGKSRPLAETLDSIQKALEKAGVVFINDDSGLGQGVRLREPVVLSPRRRRKKPKPEREE